MANSNFRFVSFLFAATLGVSLATAQDVELHGQSSIHFATLVEGKELLASRDRFITALSPFDRQGRVETDRDVSETEFIEFLQSHVREWTADESKKLTTVVDSLRPKLKDLRLPLPKSVWLIKTSGREEGDAAYCRKHAIVLPQSKLADSAAELERLLTHELFHILSSHDTALRERTYKLIGFRLVPAVPFPTSLRDRKLTNPDGPLPDAVADLEIGKDVVSVTPILYASASRFDPAQGGPFFKYLTFRLLVVESRDGEWLPVEQNGEPRLLTPAQAPDYQRKIGGNTGYIIHPDEVLAENFVHVVHKTKNLKSPEIVSNLLNALQ